MLKIAVIRDAASDTWLRFSNPREQLVATELDDVRPLVSSLEAAVEADDCYAVGYLGYESAPAFDEALSSHERGELPLVCFGLFGAPEALSTLPQFEAPEKPLQWKLETEHADYLDRVARVKAEIAEGNTYQVNYCIRQHTTDVPDAWEWFCRFAVEAPYAAYFDCGNFAVVSASPELFFSLNGQHLTCRPMKGTANRGVNLATDLKRGHELLASAKDRAENVMITDMIRNDLGRVATPGTVVAESLYDLERYPTVWQMTSSVSAQTDAPFADIVAALFPCASVTGAPKTASMKLIKALEDSPREVYTGAIGYLAPGRQATFSVAIRTAWVNLQTRVARYGVGSGLVWDSVAEDEYAECLTKARVLERSAAQRDFRLLETLRFTPTERYFLLDEHVERVKSSAAYFGFLCDEDQVRQTLDLAVQDFASQPSRVRLLLDRAGAIDIEHQPLIVDSKESAWQLKLARDAVDAANPFLYHKTTHREVYEQALASVEDCDDTLMWNADGYVTETTIANVLFALDGEWFTPPIRCGLLAGTYRARLLREGKIGERLIHKDEIDRFDRVELINAVRGRFAATIG